VCESLSGGGGGYGDARRRDPERVRAEVRDGLLSRAAAERDYGVALSADGRSVDARATARLRAPGAA
jgi:N-methylhydantoinase B